jgi:hypothetical protein
LREKHENSVRIVGVKEEIRTKVFPYKVSLSRKFGQHTNLHVFNHNGVNIIMNAVVGTFKFTKADKFNRTAFLSESALKNT